MAIIVPGWRARFEPRRDAGRRDLRTLIDVPDRELSVVDLERIAALGWQATSSHELGDWLLRAADGFTGRANSVLPLGSPGVEIDAALSTVAEFYRSRSLPARFQVPLDAPGSTLAEVDAALAARGWTSRDPTAVMTAAIDEVLDRCPRHPDLPTPDLAAHPAPDWIDGYRYHGGPLPASAIAVLINTADPVFALVRRGDVRLGVARGAVTPGWLGITAVTVDPAHRRMGVGTHLLVELAYWARARGARHIYLQVAEGNHAAAALYGRAGFVVHHRYHYRDAPTGG
jgi:ribosomal protein S18 acetylase RimI-like enzyme